MENKKPILVTCYVNPDLDGYAGTFAYAELLNKQGISAELGIIGEPHEEVKYVLNRFEITPAPLIIDDSNYEQVILVDASELSGLEGKVSPEKVVEIIDHRQVNEAGKFPQAKAQIELVGAAATLVAERFKASGQPISEVAALLLYSAIISNTLNFKAGVTTDRDREMAKWLRESLAVPDNYWQELFLAKSDFSGEKLAQRIDGDIAYFTIGGRKISVAQLELIGARELVTERLPEILAILQSIKKAQELDFIFLTNIELVAEKNYFVTEDVELQKILAPILGVEFNGAVAVREGMIMRKQIVPLLKAELEK
jgi:manganese-dependent inorganic pyrophosphatase